MEIVELIEHLVPLILLGPLPLVGTGWDWLLIGDPMITLNGDVVYDIAQAVADGLPALSILPDGQDEEQAGLANGANCALDGGPVGGEAKTAMLMQHPPWDGVTGNTISRYEISLPEVAAAAVDAADKLTTTWGQLKK